METKQFTAGSQRAIDRARHLAHSANSPAATPEYLLAALLLEENRATEILAEKGIQIDHCQNILPDSLNLAEIPPDSIPLDETALNPEFKTVLTEAHYHAAQFGKHVEIGTEFLLVGLLKQPGATSEFLKQKGVSLSELIEETEELSGFSSAPLQVEMHLQLEETSSAELSSTYRILDAAANRAREGLRVVEDFVRFTMDDSFLSRELKELRHQLTAACLKLNQQDLLDSRNTIGDVGTRISTKAEGVRHSPLDVLKANIKRFQEALRTLEEWSKSVPEENARDAASQFEQIRYQSYQLEKVISKLIDSRERLQGVSLYLLLTEELCHHGSGPAVREALRAGLKIVQLREKNLDDGLLIEHAKRVREWTYETGALFIINDRPDIAVAVDADGVHLGQEDFPVEQARRIVGSNKLIGLSTHNIEQARSAVKMGVDYIGVGPTFPTRTKQFTDYAGLDYVRQVAAEITLPWFPIGGVNQENVTQLVEAGATRCAVSSAICGAEDPFDATKEFLTALSPTN